MLRPHYFIATIIVFFSWDVLAQETCTLLNSGNLGSLNNSDWSCTGGPNNPTQITDDGLGSVIIPNGISLNINVNPTTTWNSSVTVQNGGTLTLSKRLDLTGANPCTYTLSIDTGGSLIVPSGPPGQTRLYICGSYVIGVNGSPAYTATPPETISGPQAIDDTGGSLPIELIYFKAETQIFTIKLNWATASEDNFNHFVLERSADAYEFYPIVNIQAKGGLEQFQEYTFIDEAPLPNLNYYRLKAIDHDGTFEYHPIIGVMFEGEVKQKILVYPNPVNNWKFTLRPNFEFKQGIIRITDITGKTIFTEEQLYPAQSYQLSREVKVGIYFLQFLSDQGSYLQKIVVR